ncbi:MAG: hypothetical protein ISR65_11095 [Bacteriovoracaceae bacterium]|nr:hypothetical protein [Bacteriovoracaceae bacterium]
MEWKTQKRKLKGIIINPKFQLSITGYFLFIALVILFIFYSTNLIFFLKIEELGRDLGLGKGHIYFQFIAKQRNLLNFIFIGTSFVATVVFVISGVILSHKIAGPFDKFCKHLEKLATGETMEDVFCRKGDYFQEVFALFNRHMDTYRKKISNPCKQDESQ